MYRNTFYVQFAAGLRQIKQSAASVQITGNIYIFTNFQEAKEQNEILV